jgi:hypothetical protein
MLCRYTVAKMTGLTIRRRRGVRLGESIIFPTSSIVHATCFWDSFVYLFTAAYGVSIGPIAWVLPSEIFPLVVRSKGVALSTASNWLNNCETKSSLRTCLHQLIVHQSLLV